MNAFKRSVVYAACAVFAAGCNSPDPVGESDEPIVLELVPIARFGTLDGPTELQFTTAYASLEVDPARDEVYVAEPQTREIRVFSTEGEFLRRFGRSGAGPGEFGQGPTFAVARDSVMAVDRDRLHLFDRMGELIRSERFSTEFAFPFPYSVLSDSLGFVTWFAELDPNERDGPLIERMYRVDPETFELTRIAELNLGQGSPGVFFEQRRMAHAGDAIVRTISDAYEFEVLGLDGSIRDTIRFNAPPVNADPAILDDYELYLLDRCEESASDPARCRSGVSDRMAEVSAVPNPEVRPVVGGLQGSSSGVVLVRRADLDPTPFDATDDTHFDLIDTHGRLVGRLDLPPDFVPQWISPTELWGFEVDEFDVPYVMGYRLRR